MLDASTALNAQLSSEQLRGFLAQFFPQNTTREQKVRSVENALRSPAGQQLRDTMAHWIVDRIVPVEKLVPPAYLKWRAPVRDSMTFVVAHLSPSRLAPKLVEQLELPEQTTAEQRLLRLIAKVPGLQKLGQVIARNQHLRPALRRALARLENGIRDVTAEQVRAVVEAELGPRLRKFKVELGSTILSEASVSAVIRFTWQDPATGKRRRGVFKVLKPHIPAYFAEDMEYLQGLAQYFGDAHHRYGFPAHLIPDTFRKVRRLLQHEVNFRREQKTLGEAAAQYRDMPRVRIPEVFSALCTRHITALSEERGIKVTDAAKRLPASARRRLAEKIAEALVAAPLLAAEENAVFHGDPHAGNLLYDDTTKQLTIIDWALRERLSRGQRRHLALVAIMLGLRDAAGAASHVLALSDSSMAAGSPRAKLITSTVSAFVDELPVKHLAGAADAMRLLERVAIRGLKFPAALIMLSKVVFTLDGLLKDVSGGDVGTGFAIARHMAQYWVTHRNRFRSPLTAEDWVMLNCSALLYPTRSWLKIEETLRDRYLPERAAAAPA